MHAPRPPDTAREYLTMAQLFGPVQGKHYDISRKLNPLPRNLEWAYASTNGTVATFSQSIAQHRFFPLTVPPSTLTQQQNILAR